jgi:hypothetical protein
MNQMLRQVSYEIELQSGEQLTPTPGIIQAVGAGRGRITVEPAGDAAPSARDDAAFLNGYAAEDEGLYDADSTW